VDQIDTTKLKIEQLMNHAAKLDVPLEVGIGIGDNWEQAH
jgi:DNA polymerase-1